MGTLSGTGPSDGCIRKTAPANRRKAGMHAVRSLFSRCRSIDCRTASPAVLLLAAHLQLEGGS